MQHLRAADPELSTFVDGELERQQSTLVMIASENFVSPTVLEATGSVLTNKYSEGYPGKRYYTGNKWIDRVENLTRERAKALFGVSHANVQPYSGSPANLAVCFALLDPGEKLMGLHLSYGGHLTHGWKVSASGVYYTAVPYLTNAEGWLDYDAIADTARRERPRIIFCGATAYPRTIDFARFAAIAKEVDAFLVADISHIAGLVAGGVHPSPVGHADVITTTTHKTLRGPRGAMILCNGNLSNPLKAVEKTRENIPTLIDRAIIPGLQGGPHNHTTAAIAVALYEASQPAFKDYARQIVLNAKTLADSLMNEGLDLVTAGTDNHLMVVDLTNIGVAGKEAEKTLDEVGITCNKNTVPFDTRSPFDPSGIRLGTPALTSRGFKEEDMKIIGQLIAKMVKNINDNTV